MSCPYKSSLQCSLTNTDAFGFNFEKKCMTRFLCTYEDMINYFIFSYVIWNRLRISNGPLCFLILNLGDCFIVEAITLPKEVLNLMEQAFGNLVIMCKYVSAAMKDTRYCSQFQILTHFKQLVWY